MNKRLSASVPSSPLFQATLVAAMVACGIYFDHIAAMVPAPEKVAALHADLARAQAAPEVQQVAQWAVASQDHAGLPFVVVDKSRARLFAFDPRGQFMASTPTRPASPTAQVPDEAPPGRFVADTWRSARADTMVWRNSRAAFSVQDGSGAEAAAQAGQPAAAAAGNKPAADAGVEVAADFYREYLSPLKSQLSVAYVLSESESWHDVLGQQTPADRLELSLAHRRVQETRSPS